MEEEESFEVPDSVLAGELTTMCSLDEARLRMETRQVDKFELSAAPGVVQIDPSKAVKKYQRSSADKRYLAHEVRTVPACKHSLEYLLDQVLDFESHPKPGFAAACYSANYYDIYSFLRDRLRAVRVDLHVQNAILDPVFIDVHEACLRFELLSLYLLWGRDFGGSEDRKFDLHLSLTALSQTIDPLTNAYAKRRESRTITPLELEREAEITAYIILLSLTSRGGSKTFKGHVLKQPDEIRRHKLVGEAYRIATDFYSMNCAMVLHAFADSSTAFLTACAMLPVVPLVRTRLLWRLVRTNRPFFVRRDPAAGPMPPPRPERIEAAHMWDLLGFKTTEECVAFVKFCGLDFADGAILVPPRQLTRNPVTWWTDSREWRTKASDNRDFTDYHWPEQLLEAFHLRIGEDAGDDAPPERCDYPRRIESVLVDKYVATVKVMNRKGIVTGSSVPPTPELKKVVPEPFLVPPTKLAQSYPTFGNAFFAASPKPERPIVPLQPLTIETKLLTPDMVHEKRPRDSPEKPALIDTKPAPKKLQPDVPTQPEVVKAPVAPIVVVPVKPLPCLENSFDLLAAEFNQIVISAAPAAAFVGSEFNKPIETDEDEVKEAQMARMRTKFVALKCVRAWKGVSEESLRWKWLAGSSKRAPTRLN